MKFHEYYHFVAIIFLLFTNTLFCMEKFSPDEIGCKFFILQDNDYSSLRRMPGYARPMFAHVPRDGRIEWHHLLCVDPQATDQEIRDAAAALWTQLFHEPGAKAEEFDLVKKAEREGLKELPFKVCYKKNFEDGVHEINEARLDDVLSPQERDTLAGMQNLASQWKRFYLLKYGVLSLLFFGPELYAYFEKSDQYHEIKDNEFFQSIIKDCSYLKEKADSLFGKAALFAVFGVYPLWKFWKINSIAAVLNKYRYHTIHFRDGITVFCKWNWSLSEPVGYMGSNDARTECMPIRKAKVMQVLTWFSSIGLFGYLLA